MSKVNSDGWSWCTMLDGGSLAPPSSYHVGRHSLVVPHHKRSCCGCQALKGLPYLHWTLWLLSDVCYADKGSLPQSVRRWQGQLKHLHQRSTRLCWKEWAGWCAQKGVPNNAISAPKLANFLVHLFQVGQAWCTISIYHSAISTFWSLIIFTRLLIILSFQNQCIIFIYSILLLINIFILGMLSVCYLCWRVGHPLLVSLPLSLLGRLLLF